MKGKPTLSQPPPSLSRSGDMMTPAGRGLLHALGSSTDGFHVCLLHLNSSEYLWRTVPSSGDSGEQDRRGPLHPGVHVLLWETG